MTVPSSPADRPPWFHLIPRVGPGEPSAEEAQRWQELAEASERFRRYLAGRADRDLVPALDIEVGFWSPTPVLGFRFWYVLPEGLRGVCQIWPRPELKASCARLGSGAPHVGRGCRCGIYALKEPTGLPRPEMVRVRRAAGIAYGVVALSGVVVEHERGYRAARAEVVAAAVLLRGLAVCGTDRWWIKRLFQRPYCAIEEVRKGVWPRGKIMVPSGEEVVRFLRDEARRLERAWTSVSKSG